MAKIQRSDVFALVFQAPAKPGSFLILVLAPNGNSAKRLAFPGSWKIKVRIFQWRALICFEAATTPTTRISRRAIRGRGVFLRAFRRRSWWKLDPKGWLVCLQVETIQLASVFFGFPLKQQTKGRFPFEATNKREGWGVLKNETPKKGLKARAMRMAAWN